MPIPQKSMHDVFMDGPGNKFPKKKSADHDKHTKHDHQKMHTSWYWNSKVAFTPLIAMIDGNKRCRPTKSDFETDLNSGNLMYSLRYDETREFDWLLYCLINGAYNLFLQRESTNSSSQ